MGGAVSSGSDNNELIDNLMESNYIRTAHVEQVFRAVDRADYMLPNSRDQAYKDLAWKCGPLHLSAPSIYCEVMEWLELRSGLSFLNIGSGTGYLSTIVGLILGSGGVSHGVEIQPLVVEYAQQKLDTFMSKSVYLDVMDFCEPKFYIGNGLSLSLATGYDRVYCGGGCPSTYLEYFKHLIKVGGVLVMPLNDNLVQVRRISEAVWQTRSLLQVAFTELRPSTETERSTPLQLDDVSPSSLKSLCRAVIRLAVKQRLLQLRPILASTSTWEPRERLRHRTRRICIPLDDVSEADLNSLHDLDEVSGGREMNALLSLVLSMRPARRATGSDNHSSSTDDSSSISSSDDDSIMDQDEDSNESTGRLSEFLGLRHLDSNINDLNDSQVNENKHKESSSNSAAPVNKDRTKVNSMWNNDSDSSHSYTSTSSDGDGPTRSNKKRVKSTKKELQSHSIEPVKPPLPTSGPVSSSPSGDGDCVVSDVNNSFKKQSSSGSQSRAVRMACDDSESKSNEDHASQQSHKLEDNDKDDNQRLKLDSGFDDGSNILTMDTSSSSGKARTSSSEGSGSSSSDQSNDSSSKENEKSKPAGRLRATKRRHRTEVESGSSSPTGGKKNTEYERRASERLQDMVRRLQLSHQVKEQIKDLPLPTALKLYLNYGRTQDTSL